MRPANILIGTAGIRRHGNASERKNRLEMLSRSVGTLESRLLQVRNSV
jgi:hypothetical protein